MTKFTEHHSRLDPTWYMCKTENKVQDKVLNFTFVQNLKFWFKMIINLFKYKEFIL